MKIRALPGRLRRRLSRLRNAARSLRIPEDRHPVLREPFTVDRPGHRAFVTFEPSGRRFTVNDPSIATLGLCNGSRSVAEITTLLAAESGVAAAAVSRDVRALVSRFTREGLLALHRATDPPPFIVLPGATFTGGEVEEQVRFRMGRFFDNPVRLTEDLAEAHSRGHALLVFRNGRLVRSTGLDLNRSGRTENFFAALRKLDIPRAHFSLIFAGGDGAGSHPSVPIHGHFRITGSDATILWPLAGYTATTSSIFGRDIDQHDRAWERKIDKVVWRGSTTGVVIRNMDEPAIESLIRRPGKITDRLTGEVRAKANRLQLVERYQRDERCDVGLSSFAQIDEAAKQYFRRRGFLKDRMPIGEILSYKYLVVVDGNTFASQLPWSLHCRSLVLMVPPGWEAIMQGITPWEHYVPLAADFSDLGEKIEWCRANDRRCREISGAATRLMRRYYDVQRERAVQQRLIEHYAMNFSAE